MLAILLATVVAVAPAPAANASLDPYQIFAPARQYWQQQRYPTMVGYTIHVTAMQHGAIGERHYLARWSAETNAVAVYPVSIEEQQHPFRPAGGFNFSIPLLVSGSAGGTGTGVNGDLLGVPIVAPNYFFDIARYVPPRAPTPAELVAQVRDQFHDPAPMKVAQLAAEGGPPTIATVTASHHDYDIRLLDIEPYGDHRDYHLVLKPVSDPEKYRLRELWVNTSTFATDQLLNQGNFTDGPSLGVAWMVTFGDIDGARYIVTETARSPLRISSGVVINKWQEIYESWTVSFENISPASGQFSGGGGSGTILTEPL